MQKPYEKFSIKGSFFKSKFPPSRPKTQQQQNRISILKTVNLNREILSLKGKFSLHSNKLPGQKLVNNYISMVHERKKPITEPSCNAKGILSTMLSMVQRGDPYKTQFANFPEPHPFDISRNSVEKKPESSKKPTLQETLKGKNRYQLTDNLIITAEASQNQLPTSFRKNDFHLSIGFKTNKSSARGLSPHS